MMFKIWFILSLIVLSFGIGWLANTILYVALLAIVFILMWKTKKLSMTFILIIIFSGIGHGIRYHKNNGLNRWLEGSYNQLEKRAENATRKKIIVSEAFANLQIFNTFSDKKIIVAFDKIGPVLLENKEVKLLWDRPTFIVANIHKNVIYGLVAEADLPEPLRRFEFDGEEMVNEIARGQNLMKHHYGDVFEGKLYIPGRRFRDLPDDLSKKFPEHYGKCDMKEGWRDTLSIYDAQDLTFERHIDMITASLSHPLLFIHLNETMTDCQDPIHMNTAYVIKRQIDAEKFPGGKVGDILISLRNTNTIFLLDKDAHNVKWFMSGEGGKFEQQHDPQMSSRSTMLVFDNLGSDIPHGRSRIVEIDMTTKEIIGLYESQSEEEPFNSTLRGKLQQLDETTYLIQEQYQFEEDNDRFPNVSLFILECPPAGISMECVRKNIFKGPMQEYAFSNAAVMDY